MGLRFFLMLLAVVGVVLILRHFLRRPGPGTGGPSAPAVQMVRCAHCGVHVPRPEALMRDGLSFCCRRHLEAGPRDAG